VDENEIGLRTGSWKKIFWAKREEILGEWKNTV
jgi:hypothetical protein